MKKLIITFFTTVTLIFLSSCNKKEETPPPVVTLDEYVLLVAPSGALATEVRDDEFSLKAGDRVNLSLKFFFSDGTRQVAPLDRVTWTIAAQESDALIISNNLRGFKVGSYELTATLDEGIIPKAPRVIKKTFTVTPGNADSIVLFGGNYQEETVTRQLPSPLRVRVFDNFNNPVPGTKVTFYSTDGQIIYPEVLADDLGIADTSFILGPRAGTQTVTAEIGNFIKKTNTFNIIANPDEAYQLTIKDEPESAIAGQNFSKAVRVITYDRYGNEVTTDSRQITISAAKDDKCLEAATGALMTPDPVATMYNGVASYPMVSYSKNEDIYLRVDAAAGTVRMGCSKKITVNSNAPSKLFIQRQPTASLAGQRFTSQPIIQVQDYLGNIVPLFSGTITVEPFTNSDCSIPSSGTTSHSPVSLIGGIATFTDLAHSKSEEVYLKFSYAYNNGFISICSDKLNLSADSASQIVFSSFPSQVVAGEDFSISLITKDYLGNQTFDYSKGLTIIPYNDPQCHIQANGTLLTPEPRPVFASGAVTFTTRYSKSGPLYVKVTTEDFSACSGVINVRSAAAHSISFIDEPASYNGMIAQQLTPSPIIAIKDSLGNIVQTATGVISVQAHTNSSCTNSTLQGVFSGPAANIINGKAALNNLTYTHPETIYFKATYVTANGTLTACSRPATFNPDTSRYTLSYFTQPSGSPAAGQQLTVQPVIFVSDSNGNPITIEGKVSLTAHTDSSCGNSFLATGVLTATPRDVINGKATFTDVSYSKTGNIYLKASFGSKSVCSNAISISSSSVAQLTFNVPPSSLEAAGYSFSYFSVEAQDLYGNKANTATGTVRIRTYKNNTCTQLTTTNPINMQANLSNGVAEFNNFQYTKAETIYLKADLTFGAVTVSSPCSSPVVVRAGDFTKIEVVQWPNSLGLPGSPVAVQPIIRTMDDYNNLVNINSFVEYTIYSNPTCSILDANQDKFTASVISGLSASPNLSVNGNSPVYIKAEMPAEGKTLCVNTVLNPLTPISASASKYILASGQTQSIIITGGSPPYTCSLDISDLEELVEKDPVTGDDISTGRGFLSEVTSDCATFTAGINDFMISVYSDNEEDEDSGPISQHWGNRTQTVIIMDSIGQETELTFTVPPKMSGTIQKQTLNSGDFATWTLLNPYGSYSCVSTSSIGSTISGCPSGTKRYTAGVNTTGAISTEAFIITDSIGQQVIFEIEVREATGAQPMSMRMAMPLDNNVIEQTVQVLPTISINSDGSFYCSNGDCPESIYFENGIVYTDGIVDLVTSNIPLNSKFITVGDSSKFTVGQKILIATMKEKGKDTTRIGNHEIMKITGIQNNQLMISQTNSSDGTAVVQDGVNDFVQVIVIPEFESVELYGATLSAKPFDMNNKTNGIFAVFANSITGYAGAQINMDFKGIKTKTECSLFGSCSSPEFEEFRAGGAIYIKAESLSGVEISNKGLSGTEPLFMVIQENE